MRKKIFPAIVAVLVIGISLFLIFRDKGTPEPLISTQMDMHKVTVKEVKQTSDYTYLKVSEGTRVYWIASDGQDISVGDTYYFGEALEMIDFHSKALDTIFPSIYFINELLTTPTQGDAVMEMPSEMTRKPSSFREDIAVTPPQGGVTIKELFTNRSTYQGKKVIVKGQVVKVVPAVMGKNWVHIQDGTRDGERFDLTITTQEVVQVDEVVVFEGAVSLDRDFGAGYVYEVIIEDASKK